MITSASGKGGEDVGLHCVAHFVRARQADGRIELDMELDEGRHARRARAQIVQIAHIVVAA